MSAKKQTTPKAQSLPGGDSASYVSRPRRKPDSSVKGKRVQAKVNVMF